MHVLMLVPAYFPFHLPHGGNFYHEHALAALSCGAQVGVVCPELRSIRTMRAGSAAHFRFQKETSSIDGVTVYKRLGWAIPKRPEWTDRLWIRLVRDLVRSYVADQGRPTLIHAHWGVRAGFAARQVSLEIGCPYVITEHFTGYARNTLRPWEKAQARAAYSDAAAISSVSDALARTIAPYTNGRSVAVIPNCIRMENFTLAIRRPAEHFSFLTVCHLDPKKRVDLLIRAFADRFRGCEKVRLTIGGDGPELAMLEALAQRLRVAPQVRFLGRLDRSGVRNAMHEADCFVLASRFETFGVVVIEAMATGLPVVATASGGPEEIITRETGIVVPVESCDRLAEAMGAVYSDREGWRCAAPMIRAHAQQSYSTEAVGRQLFALYESAISVQDEREQQRDS